MRSPKSDLAVSLSDPERKMHKAMIRSVTYKTEMLHNYARIDRNTAASFYDRILAASTLNKSQESRPQYTKILKIDKKGMKMESVVRPSSQDMGDEIATLLADVGVVTRARVTEISESRMAKIHNSFKAEVVETAADTFENTIQTGHCDSSEGLR